MDLIKWIFFPLLMIFWPEINVYQKNKIKNTSFFFGNDLVTETFFVGTFFISSSWEIFWTFLFYFFILIVFRKKISKNGFCFYWNLFNFYRTFIHGTWKRNEKVKKLALSLLKRQSSTCHYFPILFLLWYFTPDNAVPTGKILPLWVVSTLKYNFISMDWE